MIGVVIFALAAIWPANGQNLEKAEREQQRLEKDKNSLNNEIRMLEAESARIQKKVAEKLAIIKQQKADLAELQKQHDQLTVNYKAAQKGAIDADRETTELEEQLKAVRSDVEKITVKASLATTEYEQKRQAMLTKKADLMAQKVMLKRRTDEFEASSKAAEQEIANLNRDVARLSQTEQQAKRAVTKKRRSIQSAQEPVPVRPAEHVSATDEFAPRPDKSQRLFTIDP